MKTMLHRDPGTSYNEMESSVDLRGSCRAIMPLAMMPPLAGEVVVPIRSPDVRYASPSTCNS